MPIADRSVASTGEERRDDELPAALPSVVGLLPAPFRIHSAARPRARLPPPGSSGMRSRLVCAYGLLSLILAVGSVEICPGVRVKEIGGITCELREEILEAHNEIRRIVAAGLVDGQPPAANMRELHWDEELAEGAQDWANRCTFKHNEPADRETARFQVGQNVAVTKNRGRSPDGKEFARQVASWFGERAAYTFGGTDEDTRTTGHYTQLVWAETRLVGCGFSRFQEPDGNVSYRLYVCHYGPSGNVLGEEPYETGSRNCPDGTAPSRTYGALCASESAPRDDCRSSTATARRGETRRGSKNRRPVGEGRRNASPVRYDAGDREGRDEGAALVFFGFVLEIT